MIIPSRWFAGGKGSDEFRESMLADNRLRSIDDYLSAWDVFPGVGLKGGVCYFLWDRDNPGPCQVTTHYKDWPVSTASRPLLERGVDVFIRFNEGLAILKKVVAVENGKSARLRSPEAKFRPIGQLQISAFGLDTTLRGKEKKSGDLISISDRNRGFGYAARLKPRRTIHLSILGRSLLAPRSREGKRHLPHQNHEQTFYSERRDSICSRSYNCIRPFDSQTEAAKSLILLLLAVVSIPHLLRKLTQHTHPQSTRGYLPRRGRIWTDEICTRNMAFPHDIAFIE